MPNVNRQTIYQMGNVVNDVVKQATGRDPVKQINMDFVTVEQNTLMGIETLSGSVVEFITPKSVPLLTLEAQIVAKQNLNGYDYPWPAGGGKNKFNEEFYVIGGIVNSIGDISTNASYITLGTSEHKIPVIAGQTYFLSRNGTRVTKYVCFYNESGTFIGSREYLNAGTDITVPESAYYMMVSTLYEETEYENDLLLAFSTETADYAPYSNICPITGYTGCNISVSGGTLPELVYPIEWETEAGTVYGGVLDVLNGKLTVTYKSTTIQNLGIIEYNGIRFKTIISDITLKNTRLKGICSNYRVFNGAVVDAPDFTLIFSNTSTDTYFKDSRYNTIESFVTAMGDTQIVYELAEPVEYDVSSLSISTRAGENVFKANTGDVSLSYYVYHDLL